ncbi:uncharacterized protein [Apostichopus japonicus]|uniref:uncharacterized protein n=1 Tax=Stichopus japonicus TaxID=307972 RepID=UPI003AB4A094
MESKNTAACHCEEDLKTPNEPIEESSKPENYRSEFVFNGSTTHVGWNERESTPDVQDSIKNIPRGNHRSKSSLGNHRSKSSSHFVALAGALTLLSMIPGGSASGRCVGDGDVCLSLAQKGPDWFNQHPKCIEVRCLDLSKGQQHLRYFTKVEELFMDDMGNITIPCDVLKNWPNLHKIDLYVKNIFPTDACNTSCVLSEVTVAVLHNSTAINCNLTEWMPKLISVSFENDQAPTSVSTGIIPECVTTTAANMVNQEKDAGFSVSFKNDQAPTSVPTEITSEGVFTTPGNMVNQEKDTGIGVVIGVFALGVAVTFGVCIVVVILLHRNNIIKIVYKKSSTPVQEVLYTCASGCENV